MEFVGVGNRKNSQGYKYFPERKDINKIFLFFFFFPGPEGKQSNNKRFLNVFYWYLLVTILLVF